MRDLHGHRHAVHQHDLVAPVELVSLARRKTERHKGARRLACMVSRPTPRVTPHRVIAAVIAKRPQLFEHTDQRQPLARCLCCVRRKHSVDLSLPGAELGTRLDLPLVGKRRLARPQNLANRVAELWPKVGDGVNR